MTQGGGVASAELLANKKTELYKLLQTAFELELGTLPPYLTAIMSIKPGQNKAAANIIHQIAMEEMLHLLLVGNLMAAVGGSVEMNKDTLPTYPLRLKFDAENTFQDREFDVNLACLSEETLVTFTKIEQPRDWEAQHPRLLVAAIEVPEYTVGAFYNKVGNTLQELCGEFGEDKVFQPKDQTQANQAFYWWGRGKPIVVTGLQSALTALNTIVQQGEGASIAHLETLDKPFDNSADYSAHFFRFREVLFGRRYAETDRPRAQPSGDLLGVSFAADAVFPTITNPKGESYASGSTLARLNFEFNRRYSLMLCQVAEAFNGTPKAMYTAIMNGMHGLMPIAAQMVAMPIEGDAQGRTGAPSFEWVEPFS
jgi:hypothetical protein